MNLTCGFIPELGIAAYVATMILPVVFYTALVIYDVINDNRRKRRRRSFFNRC